MKKGRIVELIRAAFPALCMFSLLTLACGRMSGPVEEEYALIQFNVSADIAPDVSSALPSSCLLWKSSGGQMSVSGTVEADRVRYAVYDNGWNHLPLMDGELAMNGGKASCSLRLAHGKVYTLVFWADCSDRERYSIDWDNASVTMVGDVLQANDSGADAFCAVVTDVTVDDNPVLDVVLRRPLARLDIATYAQLAEFGDGSGNIPAYSSLSIDGAYLTYSFREGDVRGEPALLHYAAAEIQDSGSITDGLNALASAYLFAPASGGVADVALSLYAEDGGIMQEEAVYTASFASANVQLNRCTNIICSKQP